MIVLNLLSLIVLFYYIALFFFFFINVFACSNFEHFKFPEMKVVT